MQRKLIILSILILSISIFTGCDDSNTSSKPKLAIENVEDAYFDLFCSKAISCEQSTMLSLLFTTNAECKEFIANNPDGGIGLGTIVEKVNGGTVLYDSEAGAACISEMETLTCDYFGDSDPVICQDVFTGTIEDGGDCSINEECVSNYCDISAGCPGKCTSATAEGSSCDMDDECIEGTKCYNQTCQAFTTPLANGVECDPDADNWCAEGLYCDDATGKCETKKAENDACNDTSDEECEYGTMCLGADGSKVCTKISTITTVGDACDINAGEMCSMSADLSCAIDDFQNFTGTCQNTPHLGDKCFDKANMVMTQCDWFENLYCDTDYQSDGNCVAKKADNADCSDDGECLSGMCDNNKCAASTANSCE